MQSNLNLLGVFVRHATWFLILLASMMADLTSLSYVSPVIFPSDEALKIHLPEWVPREREHRAAQWNNYRQNPLDLNRRGNKFSVQK